MRYSWLATTVVCACARRREEVAEEDYAEAEKKNQRNSSFQPLKLKVSLSTHPLVIKDPLEV